MPCSVLPKDRGNAAIAHIEIARPAVSHAASGHEVAGSMRYRADAASAAPTDTEISNAYFRAHALPRFADINVGASASAITIAAARTTRPNPVAGNASAKTTPSAAIT